MERGALDDLDTMPSTRDTDSLTAALESAQDADTLAASMRPTLDVYGSFEKAFAHFNQTLFGDRLPATLISLSRKAHTPGHYLPARWVSTGQEERFAAEIVLNPAYITTRPIRASLAELVHQMVHHAQATLGRPGRGSYHNRQFADWMDSIGLVTTSDGTLAGSVLGPTITQRVVRGEAFDRAADDLLAGDYSLGWLDRHPPEEGDLPAELTERVTRAEVQAARAQASAKDAEPERRGATAASPMSPASAQASAADSDDDHAPPPSTSLHAESLHEPGSLPPAPDASPEACGVLDVESEDTREPLACEGMGARIQPLKRAPAGKNKIKYVCETCGDAVWGKPGIEAQCVKDGGRFADTTRTTPASTDDAANEDASADVAAA